MPRVALAEGEAGVALVVRRHERPLGFIMKPLLPRAALEPADIARIICEDFGTRLVEESVREELAPGREPDPLPSVTAAVCTKDRPERLARCLHSLLALRSTPWGSRLVFEILVVDNAPSDNRARQAVAALPGVRYVREPRVNAPSDERTREIVARTPERALRVRAVAGLDFARNCALREATGDFVAFFDDDVTVDRGWLERLRRGPCRRTPTPRRSRVRCFPTSSPRARRSSSSESAASAIASDARATARRCRGRSALSLRPGHLRRRLQHGRAARRAAGARRLRRGARHRRAAARRRRPRHVLPRHPRRDIRSSPSRMPGVPPAPPRATPSCATRSGRGASASWRSSPSRIAPTRAQRGKFRRLVAWWFAVQLAGIVRTSSGGRSGRRTCCSPSWPAASSASG